MEFVDFFDYNQITEEQEKVVREVEKWLKTVENNELLAQKVLHRFKVEPRKKIDIEDSIFNKYVKEFGGLFFSVQGYIQTDTGYDIPHCTLCASSQDLDAFFHWAVRKRLNELTEEEKEKMSGMLAPGVADADPLDDSYINKSGLDADQLDMENDISNLN